MYLSWCVIVWVIHLHVPVDELALAQPNHLHTKNKAHKQEIESGLGQLFLGGGAAL